MTVLIDSDIFIEVARGRDADVVSGWMKLIESDAAVLYSPVSVAELWAGARPKEHNALNQLFAGLSCVPIDEEVGRRAGLYVRDFKKSHGVAIADALIAASAILNSAELWTRNRKHYPMKELAFFE